MRSAWIKVSLIGLALAAAPARAGEGPHLLANLNREVSPASVEGEPSGFFELGGRLLFTTTELISLSQAILWSTDGTAAGTRFVHTVKDFPYFMPDPITAAPSRLFFTAGEAGEDLWITDGSPEGTRQVPWAAANCPLVMMPWGDRFLSFVIDYKRQLLDLYLSDGTPAGTRRIASPAGRLEYYAGLPVRLVGTVFFGVDSDAHTPQLWQTDGTPEGTRMVVDLAPGGYSSIPAFSTLTVANGYLFFAADDGKTGLEPWALPLAP